MSISNKMSHLKKIAIVFTLATTAYISSGYIENYFEISKQLDIFASLYKELNIHYVEETKPGELMTTAIDAMLESLDPYTVYYPESEIEDYRFMTTGEYGGIGTLIRKKGEFIQITDPYEGYPAQKAGLLAGDLVLAIDGKSIEGKDSDEVSKYLKGQAGSAVKLTIKRGEGEPFEVSLTREEIKIKDVPYFGEVRDKIGYIKLNSFTSTASKELIDAFKTLKEEHKIEGLIIDLRGNGGGLLMEAVNIVNVFVPKGQEVVQTKGKLEEWQRSHRALNNPIDLEIPLAIIIDEGSASASEIVSGALQDLDRAVVIGEKSFGKGLVQQTKPLSYNTTLKVTVAKYYIPSGRCIQKIDYSHKQNGKATEIPDSLLAVFETKGGRKVLDGAGIFPDIEIAPLEVSNITQSLYTKDLIFDYANVFFNKNDSIADPRTFSLTETDYEDFLAFLSGKDYDYTTKSERLLQDWEKVAKDERYFESLQEEYMAFKSKVKHNKDKDLITFQDEIKEVLENEIIGRYYFQKGRLEYNLAKDENIDTAIAILKSKERYQEILGAAMAKKDK